MREEPTARPRVFREEAWNAYRRGFEYGRLLEHSWGATVVFPLALAGLLVSATALGLMSPAHQVTAPCVIRHVGSQLIQSTAPGRVAVLVKTLEPVTAGADVMTVDSVRYVAPFDGTVSLLVSNDAVMESGQALFEVSPPGAPLEVIVRVAEVPPSPWQAKLHIGGQEADVILNDVVLLPDQRPGSQLVRASFVAPPGLAKGNGQLMFTWPATGPLQTLLGLIT